MYFRYEGRGQLVKRLEKPRDVTSPHSPPLPAWLPVSQIPIGRLNQVMEQYRFDHTLLTGFRTSSTSLRKLVHVPIPPDELTKDPDIEQDPGC